MYTHHFEAGTNLKESSGLKLTYAYLTMLKSQDHDQTDRGECSGYGVAHCLWIGNMRATLVVSERLRRDGRWPISGAWFLV